MSAMSAYNLLSHSSGVQVGWKMPLFITYTIQYSESLYIYTKILGSFYVAGTGKGLAQGPNSIG